MRLINNMNGLMSTSTFVDMHLNSTMSRTQPVLWDQIHTNPSGSLVLHTQFEDWSGTHIEDRLLDQSMRYEAHTLPLWRTYSISDLHLLQQIYQQMNKPDSISDV